MRSRDRDESHRVASSLELLFDLVFVVAISQASQNLHHLLADGRIDGILSYLMVFFAVWWAWMNFTWFASAFDTDDWLYRLMTVVQMAGVLVLAAGVHDALVSYDFTIVTWGYVVMRLAMVAQWVRAGLSDAASRRTAFTVAVGISIVQVLWVARLYLLDTTWQFITFFVLIVAEALVPVVGERQGRTSWHPHHISERYGLFTLILLGESILASATAIFEAIGKGEQLSQLIALAVAGLVIATGMWWVYFSRDSAERLSRAENGFWFGYPHYVVFAAAGAVSAGIELQIDRITGATHLPGQVVGLALAVPVALFLVSVWALLLRRLIATWTSVVVVTLAAATVLAALTPAAAAAAMPTAALLVVTVVMIEIDAARGAGSGRHRPGPPAGGWRGRTSQPAP